MNGSTMIAQNEFNHDNCAGGHLSRLGIGEFGIVNGKSACAIWINGVRSLFIRVEPSQLIGWRSTWRRGRAGIGEDQIHLGEIAKAIEVGHGDTLALDGLKCSWTDRRSEERRVGKECGGGWARCEERKE